jgi:hypothetical protein
MAIKHILALDIPDTACDTILKIWDSSSYAETLPVDCPRLDIFFPGFAEPLYITEPKIAPGFTLNLNAKDFSLQHPQAEHLISLPDGLYTIKYSVSPNDKVFVEYYHLRTTTIMNAYYKELCKVQLAPCEPSPEQHQKLHDLRYIKMYIDAAKAKTEYCHAPKQGVEMLAYADKLLKKYMTGCCVSCSGSHGGYTHGSHGHHH